LLNELSPEVEEPRFSLTCTARNHWC
jgi:hypothetical protein